MKDQRLQENENIANIQHKRSRTKQIIVYVMLLCLFDHAMLKAVKRSVQLQPNTTVKFHINLIFLQ